MDRLGWLSQCAYSQRSLPASPCREHRCSQGSLHRAGPLCSIFLSHRLVRLLHATLYVNDHMQSRTIKQESMMNRNSRSNQSIVKVKPQPRPTQPCGWCQRMACTSHGRTQLYASCYAPQGTCKEESNSSVIARILHVLNPCW